MTNLNTFFLKFYHSYYSNGIFLIKQIDLFREGNPVVDYDLLVAMAQLVPGEEHMLHPSTSGIHSTHLNAVHG